jgi:hypothetical protein
MPATTDKPPTLAKELAALDRMTAAELRDRYAAVFSKPARPGTAPGWLAGSGGSSRQSPRATGQSFSWIGISRRGSSRY